MQLTASYEVCAPHYDLFGAKDDGAFLAELPVRLGGRAEDAS